MMIYMLEVQMTVQHHITSIIRWQRKLRHDKCSSVLTLGSSFAELANFVQKDDGEAGGGGVKDTYASMQMTTAKTRIPLVMYKKWITILFWPM